MEELKAQPIMHKPNVEAFADECAYRVQTMMVVEPGTTGKTNLYLHLSGYDIQDHPIGLRILLNEVPTIDANEQILAQAFTRQQVDEYLNGRGLEVLEGTFSFPPETYTGEIGPLEIAPRELPF